jgi:hypothetical protein
MKRSTPRAALAALFVFAAAVSSYAANMAHDENGVVYAPTKALAEAVLKKAGEYRREAALEWLGDELPPSVGRVCVHVKISEEPESGLTWPNDAPGRHYHVIWMTGDEAAVTGSLLKHEMTHAVLATQFPEGLPPALDEGIASTADDPQRVAIRRRILDWYAEAGNWPRLAPILQSRVLLADDQQSYAIASSVVEFLLAREDKTTLLRFARSSKANGWDQALRMHYQIAGVSELESEWKAWAARQAGDASRVAGVANVERKTR